MSLLPKVESGDWRKPANVVTLIRLALAWIPAMLILTSPKESGWWWVAAVTFAFVAATDMLDGHLARIKDEDGRDGTTDLGKFLDPLVDKILVATTLVALCLVTPILWFPTGFIVLREVWVALVLRKPAQKAGGVIAAVFSGKLKMVAQCVMIFALIIPGNPAWVQIAAIIVAIGATIWSWIDYQRRFGSKG